MLKGDPQRKKAIGPPRSAHDVKVVHCQNSLPSRNVVEKRVWPDRNPNSLDLKDASADWTEYQEDQARPKAWELHKELDKIKGAVADVHKTKFFKSNSPVEEANTSKPTPIMKSKDRMYLVDSGASLYMMEEVLSPQEKTHDRSKPRVAPSVPQMRRVFISRISALFVREVGGSIRLSVLSLERLCDELRVTRKKPNTNKMQEDHQMLHRQFLLLVAVTHQKVARSSRHDSAGENLVPDNEAEDTMHKFAGTVL